MAASLLVVGLFVAVPHRAEAAVMTYTVTTTSDAGAGSLRQAITNANANGDNDGETDIIAFNIPGSQVHTITLASALPAIRGNVDINGYSQPGASANTKASPQAMDSVIKIQVDFDGKSAIGLNFDHDSVSGDQEYHSTLRGLSIYGATDAAVRDRDGGYSSEYHMVSIIGNYINVSATGQSMPNQGSSTRDKTGVYGASATSVGGINPADRNIIAANGSYGGAGIYAAYRGLAASGNFIGLARDGVSDLGGSVGIEINAYNTFIGGSTAASRNVISGNALAQVVIRNGYHNYIQGNYIGTDATGAVNSNLTNGVGLAVTHYAYSNIVGGGEPGEGNTIAGVSGAGISTVLQGYPVESSVPVGNAFIGNNIFDIGTFDFPGFGSSNLGIDLNGPGSSDRQGPTANDVGDPDTGPNNLINFPVLKSAQQIGNQLTITYDLDAADAIDGTYRVEFFANSERSIFGAGPGESYLGADAFATPGTNRSITLTVSGDITRKALSATTTVVGATEGDGLDGDPTGYGSTSEFSRNILIGSATDLDSDGATNSIEDAAPNNGDGNGDGIADRLQPTVTSYIANNTGIYSTLMTQGCSENGTVSSVNVASLNQRDNGYSYPYGLTDFKLNCSRGDTVNVTLLLHTDMNPAQYLPRKFNAVTKVFSGIDGSTLTQETIGGESALKLTYSATDGGSHDEDGTANGIIVDPVGLATENGGTLIPTGRSLYIIIPIGLLMFLGVGYTYRDYRRHKAPLLQSDAELHQDKARRYTYWHHLKKVTFAVARYRIIIIFERRDPRQAHTIA